MQFLRTTEGFPFSSAVITTSSRLLECVLTGIPKGSNKPVEGGVEAEMHEIFRQLDEILAQAGLYRNHIASVRLYLQHVNRDIAAVNRIYKEYFGEHPPCRRAYGVDLQSNMLIEAAFVAEFPE